MVLAELFCGKCYRRISPSMPLAGVKLAGEDIVVCPNCVDRGPIIPAAIKPWEPLGVDVCLWYFLSSVCQVFVGECRRTHSCGEHLTSDLPSESLFQELRNWQHIYEGHLNHKRICFEARESLARGIEATSIQRIQKTLEEWCQQHSIKFELR